MSRDDFFAWLVQVVAVLAITVPAAAPAQNLTCGIETHSRDRLSHWSLCERCLGADLRPEPGAQLRDQADPGTRLSGRPLCRRGLGTDLRSEPGAVLRPQADSGDRLPDRAVRGWGVGAGV